MSSVAGKFELEGGDPLAHVVRLGHRAGQTGMGIGLVFALTSHVSVLAVMPLFDTEGAAFEESHVEYDIALPPEEKEEPRPEEKPPEPAPEPEAPPSPAPVLKENTPTKAPNPESPPPPSQAAKVLTQEPDPEEPVDMTGQGFVTGNGAGPGYGMVSAAGTASAPTYNKGASLDGKEGGKGTGPVTPPAPQGPDLSKPPGLAGSSAWDCPFPPEADAEQIDQAVVSIVVTVRADGSPQSVNVVSDPGHGFGRAARLCALSRRYTPALDRSGTPRVAATPPIRVRFTR
ncbi:energy transducer TonB [Polyangium sp. y55x31]|uniref:energy transducer TonB n=1 Tax=Polyangium sp. y55x31 TaxID=3042688 RepID=UPI002482626E|nr:energy transducer TonB [Polyangium sp. y55x31]MDI1479221.1 energy transducer TonB [Polyangium sp. y55x31]